MSENHMEMRELIQNRELSQWHLMIASLLGSLASQQGMFNQAFLNRLLAHSMETFVIPYFETMPEYSIAVNEAASRTSLTEKLKPAVEFINMVFQLAGDVDVLNNNDGNPAVRIGSASCRFCPIGVGKAKMTPGDTFCPFPTMIEKTINAILGDSSVVTVMKREGMKTKILEKKDGNCYIAFKGS
ncbi:hypothetical protein CSA37_04540 [Candidatus Fermentibacteria bacterium]|nr:MAG: hypothetical protein CSA37_04540 [Candidatus Fermentibacteria bacterium]